MGRYDREQRKMRRIEQRRWPHRWDGDCVERSEQQQAVARAPSDAAKRDATPEIIICNVLALVILQRSVERVTRIKHSLWISAGNEKRALRRQRRDQFEHEHANTHS